MVNSKRIQERYERALKRRAKRDQKKEYKRSQRKQRKVQRWIKQDEKQTKREKRAQEMFKGVELSALEYYCGRQERLVVVAQMLVAFLYLFSALFIILPVINAAPFPFALRLLIFLAVVLVVPLIVSGSNKFYNYMEKNMLCEIELRRRRVSETQEADNLEKYTSKHSRRDRIDEQK